VGGIATLVGIDIGGTSIKGIAADHRGRVLEELSVPTEAARGRTGILSSLDNLAALLLERHPESEAIGIASAGRIDAGSGEVAYATDNLPGWTGMRLSEWAGLRFGLPVRVDNDANAALLGECWIGSGRGLRDAVMLTLGTGVGGANLAGGRLLRGARWGGGDWGHVVLVPGGRPCNCGRRGCAEMYLSGTALMRDASAAFGTIGPEGLMERYRAGDAAALRLLRNYAGLLAVFIGNLAAALDPEAVLLGGGAADSLREWRPLLDEALASEGVRIEVRPALLGTAAGCCGAARMALDLMGRTTEEETA